MDYRIRVAAPDDVPALMALRVEAEQWLAAAGIDQWSNSELGAKAIAKWRATIDDGRTWVLVDDADAVAATVSTGPADADFWREDDEPANARYVYKLIVSRRAAGTGLGARILDWMSILAHAEGRAWLRLDVWRDNAGLQAYYQKYGFTHVRTEAPAHRLSGWLGQRPAGYMTHPAKALVPLSSRRGVDQAVLSLSLASAGLATAEQALHQLGENPETQLSTSKFIGIEGKLLEARRTVDDALADLGRIPAGRSKTAPEQPLPAAS